MAENIKGKSHILDISKSWERERPDLELTNFLFAIYAMRLGRMVDDAYDDMCRKRFGISGSDMRVLFALRRAGKPYVRRATDLFRALLVTSGAVTKQVDRLSKLGLVSRIEDPNLPMGVQLTAKGLRVANQATDLLATASPVAPGVIGMSKSEFAAGRAFVEKVLQGLEMANPTPRRGSTRRIKNDDPA
jgi:DNA-binding MarR family transcriptional regulator